MRPFTYERARSPTEAASAATRNPGTKFIAGGTSLLDLMKLQIETPSHLIDVNGLGLDRIEATPEGGLRIGALVRDTDLAADERVRRDYGVLSRALLAGASGQLRNRATTAGNLLQRTRCPYFYDTNMPCNKRALDSGCSAIGGVTRGARGDWDERGLHRHPSQRHGDCHAGAGRSGGDGASGRHDAPHPDRRIPSPPGRDAAHRDGAGEGGVHHRRDSTGAAWLTAAYRKVRDRASYAFALVSIAAVVQRDGTGRVALGGVAHKPWRVEAAEAELPRGAEPAMAAILDGAQPTHGNAFKVILAERALASVLTRATG